MSRFGENLDTSSQMSPRHSSEVLSKELAIHMCSFGGRSGLETDIWELCVEGVERKGTEDKRGKKAKMP